MPRLRQIDESEQTAGSRDVIAFSQANGAPDARIAAIYARTPLGVDFLGFWSRLMGPGALDVRLKELVRIQVSVSGECGYCSVIRSAAGREVGVNEALVAELVDFARSNVFTPRERAALHFATLYARAPEELLDDAEWDGIAAHFSDEELIELGLVLSLVTGGGTFAKALQVVGWDEVCDLRPEMQRALQRKAERDRVAVLAHG